MPAVRAVVVAALAGTAAGCAGGDVADPATVTVTVAAGTTAGARSTTAPVGGTAATEPSEPSTRGGLPRLDREHDAALVVGSALAADGLVLSIDRLTVAGLSDAQLAAEGAPLDLDAPDRFSNQNVKLYEVGVARTARWVLTTCDDTPEGPALSSTGLTAEAFLATPGLDTTPVLVRYVDGLVDRVETSPTCP